MRRSIIIAVTLVGGAAVLGLPAGAVGRAGHFDASAGAELVRFETIRPVIPPMVDAALGLAVAEASTVGLEDGGTTHARAANGEAIFFGAGGGAGPTVAEQRAGDDNAEPAEQVSPRIAVGVVDAGTGLSRAHARRIDVLGGMCPDADASGARVLSTADTELTDVLVGDVVQVTGGGTVHTTVLLRPTPEEGRLAVEAQATTRVGQIDLAGRYRLRVVDQPRLIARAPGSPVGAGIFYTAPVIDVIDLATGDSITRLSATDHSVDLPGDPVLGSFVNVRLGDVHDVITLNDGTHARAEADLVEIRFTDVAGAYEQFDLRIGALSASATAPRGGVTACDSPMPRHDTDLPHAIVYSGWRTFEHLSIEPANRAIADLANDSGTFTVSFTDEASFLRPEVLAETDLIIWNNATGTIPWTQAQKDLFVSWLLCGGGTVGIHAATDANHSWPEYTELMGARFASHPHVGYWPHVGDASIQVEDQTHPATAPWHGMPSFRMADELYQFVEDPRGTQDVTVLLSLDEESTYPWVAAGGAPLPSPFGGSYVEDQPLAWTKTFRGEGRVFYTNLGHNPFTHARADFREHLLNGITWVTGVRPDADCLTGG